MDENLDLINEDVFEDDVSDIIHGVHFDDFKIHVESPMLASPSFENDPNGGVIVTDIFGGKHHYMDMEQAQTLTDFMSGFPVNSQPVMPFADITSDEGHLPTDIHTPVDLSFYDDKLLDANRRLDRALDDAAHAVNETDLEDAMNRQRQAKNDLDYWEGCRSRAEYNQTVEHQRCDRIINGCNSALNDFHDILNKQ